MPKIVPALPGMEPIDLPLSRVVEANGFVFLAAVGGAPGIAGPVPGGIEPETRQMLENIGRLLRAVDLDFDAVVKTTVYLRDFDDFASMNRVYREYFNTEPPARATVGVAALSRGCHVEIDVIATR